MIYLDLVVGFCLKFVLVLTIVCLVAGIISCIAIARDASDSNQEKSTTENKTK